MEKTLHVKIKELYTITIGMKVIDYFSKLD